jgi:hypothetical protein
VIGAVEQMMDSVQRETDLQVVMINGIAVPDVSQPLAPGGEMVRVGRQTRRLCLLKTP